MKEEDNRGSEAGGAAKPNRSQPYSYTLTATYCSVTVTPRYQRQCGYLIDHISHIALCSFLAITAWDRL